MTKDKFLSELHLTQPGFTYCACRPFTKHHEIIQKFRKTGNLKHLYRNELGKACFAHDATYSDSKDLAKKTISNKILKDRAYEIWWISKSISKYGLLIFLIRKQDWEWM